MLLSQFLANRKAPDVMALDRTSWLSAVGVAMSEGVDHETIASFRTGKPGRNHDAGRALLAAVEASKRTTTTRETKHKRVEEEGDPDVELDDEESDATPPHVAPEKLPARRKKKPTSVAALSHRLDRLEQDDAVAKQRAAAADPETQRLALTMSVGLAPDAAAELRRAITGETVAPHRSRRVDVDESEHAEAIATLTWGMSPAAADAAKLDYLRRLGGKKGL